MKMRFWYMILLWTGICLSAMGQTEGLPQGHPRYLTNADGKQETLRLIKEEAWAQEAKTGCPRACRCIGTPVLRRYI